jgi:hypothetical protein
MKAINSTGEKYYIQRKDQRDLETVDQFDTRKEARAMLVEYQLSELGAIYYISSRHCAG